MIDGADPGGVTEATGWKGGGGFRYYKLAPSLLKQDKWGNLVINKEFNPDMLAEAVCKLEGYVYAPSDTVSAFIRLPPSLRFRLHLISVRRVGATSAGFVVSD